MIYKRMRTLRTDHKLTQAAVAKGIHVSARNYSYYENGKRTIPPYVLISLSIFYQTSVDYLLGLTDIRTPYSPHHKKG